VLVAAVVLLAPLSRRGADAARARKVLRGFRVPAVLCVVTMVVTGVYLASGVVGSVDAALLTNYGRTLLLKVAVVAVVGMLGAVTSTRLHARRERRSPARTILAEALLGVVVLGLAAVLTAGQPAREPQFVDAANGRPVPVVSGAVGEFQESVSLRPNLPGHSVALVDVFDTRRPVLAPVRRVLVAVTGAGGRWGAPVAAGEVSDGRWSVPTTLAAPGRVLVRVMVQREGFADTVHEFTWTVGGATARTRAATVSTAPIREPLVALSAVLAVLALLGGGIALARGPVRRRRSAGPVEATAFDPASGTSELLDA
jgi:copper transport protein